MDSNRTRNGQPRQPRWSCRVDCGRDGDRPNQRRPARRRTRWPRRSPPGCPDVRLLTDAIDRESYRLDETAYLGRAAARGRLPDDDRRGRRARARSRRELRVPIVPRGAGHGAVRRRRRASRAALTIAFTRDGPDPRDRPREPRRGRPAGRSSTPTLKAAVAAEGLFYPPDPASFEMCSIGGNLGTNAGGLCCVKYGQTRDSVLVARGGAWPTARSSGPVAGT